MLKNILCVDVGDKNSGYVLINEDKIILSRKTLNEELFNYLKSHKNDINLVVIEMPVIFGSSNNIRNTLLFTGQLIQLLRHLNIDYYSGITRASVKGHLLLKKEAKEDYELQNIKSTDARIKILMKRIFGNEISNILKTGDEYQALALYVVYKYKVENNLIDDNYLNNFYFITKPRKKKNRKKKK